MFKTSVVYQANLNAVDPIVVNQGGSYSSKTYSILQVLFTIAVQGNNLPNKVITVAGESIPNLKAGALRDALDMVNDSPVLQNFITDYNKTDRVFSFRSGFQMEFKSYLTPQDAKSGKRQYFFMNEANGQSFEVFDQLEMRTTIRSFIDYNPDAEFWVHEKLIGQPGVKLIISDHRHNPFVPQKNRDRLEGLKFRDMDLFKVYARGLTGKIEGLIFRNYEIIEDVPLGAELIACGLDWGYSNDPTSFGKLFQIDKDLIIDELLYETGLTNSDIITKLQGLGIPHNWEIVADSSEPKSIEDIRRAGFRINAAEKGPDSIRNSIDTLKPYNLKITRRSIGIKKEIRSYKWATDKTGKPLYPPEPVDFNNHTIDWVRYIALNKIGKNTGKYSFL